MTAQIALNATVLASPSDEGEFGRSTLGQWESSSFQGLFDSILEELDNLRTTEEDADATATAAPEYASITSNIEQAAQAGSLGQPESSTQRLIVAAHAVSGVTAAVAQYPPVAVPGKQTTFVSRLNATRNLTATMATHAFVQAYGCEWMMRNVTAAFTRNQAHVYVRDSNIAEGEHALLLRKLQAELSWVGVALGSLIVNGKRAT